MSCMCTGRCKYPPYTCSGSGTYHIPVEIIPGQMAVGHTSLQSQGCVCPAGANLTCQSPTCPRKPWSVVSAAIAKDPQQQEAPADIWEEAFGIKLTPKDPQL